MNARLSAIHGRQIIARRSRVKVAAERNDNGATLTVFGDQLAAELRLNRQAVRNLVHGLGRTLQDACRRR